MAKILTHYTGKHTKFKQLLHAYKSVDPFTKSFIIVMLFLSIMTPTIITTRMILQNHAADKFYIAATGSGENTIFTMTEVEPSEITDTSATITWKTSAPSRSVVTVWENTYRGYILSFFFKQTIPIYTYTTDHEVNLSSYLKPHTSYKYSIVSTTKSGDTFTSPSYTFKTAD